MEKEVALDTNAVIAFLNGDEAMLKEIKHIDIVYLPITVVGELLFGALNSTRAKINLPKFQAFIDNCEILNINE
jgi:tRNA(fMet)-specific endonuclease VapC